MSAAKRSVVNRLKLTLDGWAVAAAFALALLVRAGVLKHVPW